MSTPTVGNLKGLVNIINAHVDIIENYAVGSGVTYPTIDDIYDSNSPNEQFALKTEVIQAAMLAASAATQLAATLKLPGLAMYEKSHDFYVPAALGITSSACAVELLREAGPEGMSAEDIAARTGTNANLLGRAMRLLATHYIFREIKPNVFTNNRRSSTMDTGKSSQFLVALTIDKMNIPPDESGKVVRKVHGEKYKGTNGVAAFVDMAVDINFKAAAFIPDSFLNLTGGSKSNFEAAYGVADLWSYCESRPGYIERFQSVMQSRSMIHPPNTNRDEFNLSSIVEGGVVVDVGGGSGSITFELARNAPHLSFVVQDLEQTICKSTVPYWKEAPERNAMITSGRVKLQAQNFFEAQPIIFPPPAVFFLRCILHDWPNAECVAILKNLRNAALKETLLIIVDQIMPYACHSDDISGVKMHGCSLPPAPKPLLVNLGEADPTVYLSDFLMYSIANNGQERTLGEFEVLLREAGWKVEQVFRNMGTPMSKIVCKIV